MDLDTLINSLQPFYIRKGVIYFLGEKVYWTVVIYDSIGSACITLIFKPILH